MFSIAWVCASASPTDYGQPVSVKEEPKIIGGAPSSNLWIGLGTVPAPGNPDNLDYCGGSYIYDYSGFLAGGCSRCRGDDTCYRPKGANYPTCQGGWFVSAAHCLVEGLHEVGGIQYPRFLWNTAVVQPPAAGRLTDVCEHVYIHPYYDNETLENDVALCKLKNKPSPTSAGPAYLFTPNPFFNALVAPGTPVILSGFGTTSTTNPTLSNQQLQVVVRTVSNPRCQTQLSPQPVFPSQLCTGGPQDPGKDSCQGDSGGPAFRSIVVRTPYGFEAVPFVAGLVSAGRGCAEGYPALNSRVSAFFPWIRQTQICARLFASTNQCVSPCELVTHPTDGDTVCQAKASAPTPAPTTAEPTSRPTRRPTRTPTRRPVRGV